jgi:NADPH:quinone reductase-like Zn-dependent oxidoreductase
MGMINPARNGAYAEKIVAPAAAFVTVPDGVDLADAAALPMGCLTGVQLIELGAKARAGQRILVTGAAGSVGRAAVYAAVMTGAEVVAGLPLAAIVDLGDPEAVAAAGPFDAIADTVGGRVAERLCRYVKPGGVLASVASPAPLPPVGSPVASAPVWVSFDGPRLAKFAADLRANGWTMPVAMKLPLAEAAKAHTLIEAGGLGGKILLTP